MGRGQIYVDDKGNFVLEARRVSGIGEVPVPFFKCADTCKPLLF